MSMTDIILLLLVIAGITYGFLRGMRPALFLLMTLLASLLAVELITVPLEDLVLRMTGVGVDLYPDAPAVVVFILENQTEYAYLVSLLPSILVFFFILTLVIGGVLLKPLFRKGSGHITSRIFGALCGSVAGITADLIIIFQLSRLPWLTASEMFRNSLLISSLNLFFPTLISAFAVRF